MHGPSSSLTLSVALSVTLALAAPMAGAQPRDSRGDFGRGVDPARTEFERALAFARSEPGPALPPAEAQKLAEQVAEGGPGAAAEFERAYRTLHEKLGPGTTPSELARCAAVAARTGKGAAARLDRLVSVFVPASDRKEPPQATLAALATLLRGDERVPVASDDDPARVEYERAFRFAFNGPGPDLSRDKAGEVAAVVVRGGPGAAAEFERIFTAIREKTGGGVSNERAAERAASLSVSGKGAAERFLRAWSAFAPRSDRKEPPDATLEFIESRAKEAQLSPSASASNDPGQVEYERAYAFAFNQPGPDLGRKEAGELASTVRNGGPGAALEFERIFSHARSIGGPGLTPEAAARASARAARVGGGAALEFERLSAVYAPRDDKKEPPSVTMDFLVERLEARQRSIASGPSPSDVEYERAYRFAFNQPGPDLGREDAANVAEIVSKGGPGAAAEFERIYADLRQNAGPGLDAKNAATAAARVARTGGQGSAVAFQRAWEAFAPRDGNKEPPTATLEFIVGRIECANPRWNHETLGGPSVEFERAYRFAFNAPGPDLSRADAAEVASVVEQGGPGSAAALETIYQSIQSMVGPGLAAADGAKAAARVARRGSGAAANFQRELERVLAEPGERPPASELIRRAEEASKEAKGQSRSEGAAATEPAPAYRDLERR